MRTYNSLKEFQDAVYAAAISKKSLSGMCEAQCKKGTVKSKVRSAKDSGSSMNMTSSNLKSVAQDYVDNHLKATKKVKQTIQLTGDTVSYTFHKIDQSTARTTCNISVDRSFSITGNVEYGAASVTATASYSDHTDTTTDNYESHYSEDTCTMTFSGSSGTAVIYYNAYTCSDAPTLDVIYTFDTITINATCTYKGDTGITWLNGAERGESRTYNLADLGFGGPVCIKTPTVFDVSCSDEWVSKEMK
jgi:hypothetical protein